MKRVHMYLAAGATAVALAAGVVTAQPDVIVAEPAAQATRGIEHLNPQLVDLPNLNSAWTNMPLTVTLPQAGTYALDADVRGRITGPPGANSYIVARLWNETAGSVVPLSERMIIQLINRHPVGIEIGDNETAPISELVDVSQQTTIRLQARRLDRGSNVASVVEIRSDNNGYTSLRYQRIFP
ncbi:hypothetical protein [Actinophytocola gossypii]|uniref:Uncharacterized protein n=1 Tax=Actinophytocola gossypii TaxID=2812003 RepID=A0ABT2J1L7_9PSEU|nr:hypothetical protein [Actinophytocola gossypii]MCT2581753.1 hypothetical protein [Actinophytocola gossypii]